MCVFVPSANISSFSRLFFQHAPDPQLVNRLHLPVEGSRLCERLVGWLVGFLVDFGQQKKWNRRVTRIEIRRQDKSYAYRKCLLVSRDPCVYAVFNDKVSLGNLVWCSLELQLFNKLAYAIVFLQEFQWEIKFPYLLGKLVQVARTV